MVLNIISWIFGVAVFAAGGVNLFWGNDPGLGVFLVLLSFVYFPPTDIILNTLLKEKIGFSIPTIGKIVLGILIIWVTLGVGELANKIDLMRMGL